MNCNQVAAETIAYLKDELSEDRKKRFDEHLAMCPDCRRQLASARRLLTQMAAADDAAVVRRLLDHISAAIRAGASDIHLEPQKDDSLLVRYRVDGVLSEADTIDAATRLGVEARLKMYAELNLDEHLLPQDGRMLTSVDGREYDLRVSAIPFIYGEGFVLRILDRSNVLVGLDRLGFYPDHLETLRQIIHSPNGLFLFAGPTGSGKTTTMYSAIAELASPSLKTLTVEDPVEYRLDHTNQVNVNSKAGLTYPVVLRSLMRHDPDVVMCGEIRDFDSLAIILQLAITGHMVFSSVHTPDAVASALRLVDVGAEPYLVGAALRGVLAQRLARKVCPSCRTEASADDDTGALSFLRISPDDLQSHTLVRGAGCDACRNTGYRGRVGLYELLEIDRELASMITGRVPASELLEAAQARGFVTLRDDARRKVLDGITTPEEAVRCVSL